MTNNVRIQGDNINVQEWASTLTEEQMRQALIDTVEYLVETEDVRLGELAPYWEACGEPIVAGQKTYIE
jgi:hypothetical protein